MRDFLTELGIEQDNFGASTGSFMETSGDWLESVSPVDGEVIARVRQATEAEYDRVATTAHETFTKWRMVPAPKRGEIVRQIAIRLRDKKTDLAKHVSYEMGKIHTEA